MRHTNNQLNVAVIVICPSIVGSDDLVSALAKMSDGLYRENAVVLELGRYGQKEQIKARCKKFCGTYRWINFEFKYRDLGLKYQKTIPLKWRGCS